jgi:ketosteroid isomerase-like protein
MSRHIETVEAIYAAFGRGDIDAIVARLSPQVAWEPWNDNFAQRAGVPWMQPRRGHAGAREFFAALAALDIHDFAVLSIMGSERQVAVEFTIDATVRATGRRFFEEEVHLWSFDADGHVVRFRHYLDTAKHIEAARAG